MISPLSIRELEIQEDEFGLPRSIYLDRVATRLSHFPREIIDTWFREHPDSMRQWFPLGYEDLRFEKLKFTTKELGGTDIFKQGARCPEDILASMPIDHLLLLRYWQTHKDWPVPPILLDVRSSILPTSFPFPLREPYHLIEGYHRLALAIDADRHAPAPITRDYWVVRILASDPDALQSGGGVNPATLGSL